jgi:hypothetical protein
MSRIGTGPPGGPISKLPRNEYTPLATDLHARDSLIEAGNQPPEALRKRQGLRRSELGLAIVAHDRLSILAKDRRTVIFGGVELAAVVWAPIRSEVPGIEHLVDLIRISRSSGAGLKLFVTQREGGLHRTVRQMGNRRRQG